MKYLLGFIFILLLQNCTNATDFDGNNESYSYSTLGLLKLLDLEQEFVKNLYSYVDLLTEKIATLKIYINSMQYNSTENQSEREEYVLNPLNAFSLMRRTYQDMPKWHKYAKSAIGLDQIEALEEILVKIPNGIDMNNTLESVTHGLDPNDMANGRLQNGQYSTQYKEAALGYHQLLCQKNYISNGNFSNRQNNKHKC